MNFGSDWEYWKQTFPFVFFKTSRIRSSLLSHIHMHWRNMTHNTEKNITSAMVEHSSGNEVSLGKCRNFAFGEKVWRSFYSSVSSANLFHEMLRFCFWRQQNKYLSFLFLKVGISSIFPGMKEWVLMNCLTYH